MIIEQHYDEEVLAEFLGEPDGAATRDKHLASCSLCQRTLASLRTTSRTLTQPAVWDKNPVSTTPRSDTLAFLRDMQKSLADEDAMATVWIKQLLAGPRETWAARLAEHPEWRTGGMVRRLNAESEKTVSNVPEDGLAMAALAIHIAKLNLVAMSSSQMRQSAGLAYFHHGYALWYTGKMLEALEDFDRAEQILSSCVSAELDCARVWLMRAMVYQMLERRDDALELAKHASAVFLRYGDRDRIAAARSVCAITLQESQRYREAAAIHAEIAALDGISDRWRYSAIGNLGLCQQALGELDQALQNLLEASAGCERIGMTTFRSKTRWALADVFAQQGKHEQALAVYGDLRAEFEELGMWNDVALISLDASELLVALERTSEVGEICRAAIDYFVANGLAQTEPALRGLSYLHEAAAAGRAMPSAIRDVRAYLLEPTKPTLLFARPHQ